MTGLIVLNLGRNSGRTLLTSAGIPVGVATIVALLSASGFVSPALTLGRSGIGV